jgi:3-hydroxyacyl-[acyl-carrier-protein] dehydratase
MRFNLLDRIVEIEPGRMIRALKNLTLGEEYLADHFPTFPVMPGVLMLQTLVEASSWLLRLTDDYRYSVYVLREVRGLKFGAFMEPGRQMQVTSELVERNGAEATFKGKGEADGNMTVMARLTLAGYNLRDRNPTLSSTDERIVGGLRNLCGILQGEVLARTKDA